MSRKLALSLLLIVLGLVGWDATQTHDDYAQAGTVDSGVHSMDDATGIPGSDR